jgi:protein tyrosine/serine phosphatase
MNKKQLQAGLWVILLATAAVLLVNHFHIADFTIIKPNVLYTSGQPRGMDYTRLLYKYHIATIVNVRLVSEHRNQNWYNEEVAFVRNNGLNYFELTIEKGGNYFPDKQTQEQFLDVMANKDKLPVLLHGSRDDKRVAMLMAVWLRQTQGYTAEEAIGEVKRVIDDRKLTEAEIRFISDLAK